MNEELINTIFYYANTMDEYRLALQLNKILSRTIVFVDETLEIYKDGKLFGGYEKFVEQINNLAQEVRDAMDLSEQSMLDLMRRLRDQIWDLFQEEVDLITQNILDYEDRLNRLREEFDLGVIEEGHAQLSIDELNGIISQFVSWKTSVDQTLITFSSVMNAQDATLRTFGERLDAFNNAVTNYEHLVDLKEQSLKEYIENYDMTAKVRSIIGREILLQDGLLHDFATITNINDMVRTSVDTWFNSLEPSWTQVTSWAQGGYDKATANEIALAGFRSSITGINDQLAGIAAEAAMFSNWYNGNKEALSYVLTHAGEDESFFDLIAKFDTDDELVAHVAARVFGYANSEGSNLVLQADHITMLGTDFQVDVSQVTGLGDWILANVTVNKFQATDGSGRTIKINADSNDVYGIKSSTNGFYFKMDGSGWVANGAITWDAYGNLTIQGQSPNAYTPSGLNKTVVLNNVYISDYWSKTEFNPSSYVTTGYLTDKLGDITGLTGGLKAWVLLKIQDAGTQEGQEINVELLVQTTLNNEIGRADGPFANFIRNSDLSTTLDGYVTKQGLGTEVSALIYDGQGNLISGGILYDALSTLNTLSGALIQDGRVVGTYTEELLSSKVNDFVNNNLSIASLKTWAQTLQDYPSAGFSLGAFINTITGGNVTSNADIAAQIIGEVNAQGSSITISADRIDLTGTTFALDIIATALSVNNGDIFTGVNINTSYIEIKEVGGFYSYHYLTLSPNGINCGLTGGNSVNNYSWSITDSGIEFSNGGTITPSGTGTYSMNGNDPRTFTFNGDIVSLDIHSGAISCTDINASGQIGAYALLIELDGGIAFDSYASIIYNPSFRNNSGAIDFSTRIHVDGGIFAEGALTIYGNLINFGNSGEIEYDPNSSEFIFNRGADFGGPVTQSSDIRLKENFVDVTATTEDIAKVRTVNFNFKGKDETIFGSIAQDWLSIFPYAVKEGSDGMLSMDYGAIALGSAVTAAREIVALKKRIEELEAKLK